MSDLQTLYLIHHSHTDIGYTHDQPIVFDLHERFIDEAVRLAEQFAASDSDGAFRWTVENTYVLKRWLDNAPQTLIDRFLALEKAGRIEVTAMFANLTPLLDTGQLIETFQLLRTLRNDYGLTIRHAMNCDVNGENWPLVDLLLDLGIEGFTMAINTHFGGAPFERPNAFKWQGPSGRTLYAYNGWPYDTGWRFGIGRDERDFAETWLPRLRRRLDAIGYRLPVVMAQSFHPFGDNGPAFEGFSEWIDSWNAAGGAPRIVLATPAQWWAAVRRYDDLLETHRGDWTDFWNFGAGSSAREAAINRASRTRLRAADAATAAYLGTSGTDTDPWLTDGYARYRTKAWDALHFWDEHTWGADCAISDPYSEDTASQWHHKAHFAYEARSLSLMLQRDALAALARSVQGDGAEDVLIFNPLPWPRTLTGDLPHHVVNYRGPREDSTSGRHAQDRKTLPGAVWPTVEPMEEEARSSVFSTHQRRVQERVALPPTEVPGYGYAVVPRARLATYAPYADSSDGETVETARFRVTFDRERGGVASLIDKELDHEWVDGETGWAFNGYVHEEVAEREVAWPRHQMFYMIWQSEQFERDRGWKPNWGALRRGPGKLLSHHVYRTPLGHNVVQVLDAPGCEGPLVQSTFLPEGGGYIDFWSHWQMGLDTHPQAAYLLYPFSLPGAVARIDLGPQALLPGAEQLPGVCRDYFTVQNWVDFSNEHMGVTVATPDNPLVQLGGFQFAENQYDFVLERPMLLGWVTNNYWETNFRAHQPGRVYARYRVHPHAGPFDESRAHRLGLEAANDSLLAQQMGESGGSRAYRPTQGSLLALPQPPVQVLAVKPSQGAPGVVVRLINASDAPQTAHLGSGLLRILAARTCDLLDQPTDQMLAVHGGAVELEIAPRRVAVLHLTVMDA